MNYPDDLYVMGAYNTTKGRIWIMKHQETMRQQFVSRMKDKREL